MAARQRGRRRRLVGSLLSAGLLAGLLVVAAGPAARPALSAATFNSAGLTFTAGDGVPLHASLGWFGSLAPRPLIVEDSPYAPQVSTLDWSGPAYNYLELQWRGTGLSQGSLDSTGTRDQQDLSEFLEWACGQSWSAGSIGLYGFSASAIIVYNSMHLLSSLECVKTAVLMSGTVDLYRDLLYIGGVASPVVGSAVEGLILAPWFQNLGVRAQTEPGSVAGSVGGLATAPVDVAINQTEDAFWNERTFQGDPSHIPVLADDGFYDVEERGAFQGFSATAGYGSHLLVYGAHDGFPANVDPFSTFYAPWFNHYLLGDNNGIDSQPAVQALLSNGSREQFLLDQVTAVSGSAWPLAGTVWNDLYLSSVTNSSVASINDGTLDSTPDATTSQQSYPYVPSEATETDVHSVAAVAGDGLDQAATYFPQLTNMDLSGSTSLTYTTPPLQTAVDAVGPVGLDLYASSTAPFTDLVAVVADVWPDGTAYPVATGWLRTEYPNISPACSSSDNTNCSLDDPVGDVIDPYTDFSSQNDALPGTMRQYHIEVLPIGNHFACGHRIRLYILGIPGDMQGAPPGVNTLSMGGLNLSRLVVPTVGTTLTSAFSQSGQCS